MRSQTNNPLPHCGSHDLSENLWSLDAGEVDAIECNQCFSGAPVEAWERRPDPWQSSRHGGGWPRTGETYLICINGIAQKETWIFDRDDSDFGGGDYFWYREDCDDCPLFDSENDLWMPIPPVVEVKP
jgi:hypothetical protein